MKDLYHTINPIIRIKENELLSNGIFQQLIEANSFEQIAEILGPTIYGKYLNTHFQFEFEQILNDELSATYQEMITLTPDSDIVWMYTMRNTFHNLKILTKAEKISENYDYLYLPDGFYSIEELKNAIETGVSTRLPESILESIQEVEAYFQEATILQGIDVIYDRQFLKEQRRLAEITGSLELLEKTICFIDLTNIIITARCILQKRSYGFMSAVLSSAGSITKENFLEYADRPMKDFMSFLLLSEYGDLLLPALKEDINFLKLDLIKDNYLTSFFEQSKTTAFGPLPLLAFLNAKEIEATNLRLIIVGKRSGFTKEQIRERMRKIIE